MAASILLVALVLEVVLRLTGMQGDFFYQLDPEVGAIHIPGKRGWAVSPLGWQYVEMNSHGYRGREWSVEKPSGTYRIAVLGDSFAEAFQLPEERTFAARTEQGLNRQCGPGRRFEVLNFGVAGFGTGQELETLRLRVLRFQPDLVLLYFYGSNDVYDNSKELDVEPNRLHFALGDDGRLVRLPFTVRDDPVKQWLRHHSRLYLFVRDRIKTLAAVDRAMQVLHLMQEQAGQDATGERAALRAVQDNRYRVPPSPALERAWRLTEALLAETRRVSEQASARFGVVIIPNQEEVLNDGPRPPGPAGSWDFQQSLKRMDAVCDRLAMSCLRLVQPIRDSKLPMDQVYIPNDGHFADAGHAIVAAETVRFVRGWACGAATGS
jgi:GDSL-like Lipase/Acylhydrolase family